MRKSENSYAKVIRRRFIFHTTRFTSKREVYDATSLQYRHGGGSCCRQNDVTVIPYIRWSKFDIVQVGYLSRNANKN